MTDNRNAWTRYYESTLPRRRESMRKPRAGGTVPLEGVSRRSGVRVVQSEKQAPKVLRGAEKQIAEDNAQFRRYNRAKAAAYKAALMGSSSDLIRQLRDTLKQIDIEQPDQLIRFVNGSEWRLVATGDRYTALSMIDDAITDLREQNGLAPFDDAIFDEEPTVFQICKARLSVP